VIDDAHKPKISTLIRAAIAKPVKFYFAVPSVDLANWLVVEAGRPEQPMGNCSAQRPKHGLWPTP
jgi:hypothetical protein